MYKGKKIIALIPAKENSTRLPNKNIRYLLGKPLFAWSIESAKQSKYIDEIVVSTDSELIKNLSARYNIKVLDRPKELCTSESHIKETIKHTVENVETDYVLLMNPTSPLRYNIDIFLNQFDPNNYDTVASVEERKIYPWCSSDIANMQSLKPYMWDTGSLYIHSSWYIKRNYYWCLDENRRQTIITPKYMNYEIDDETDWLVIEALMKKYLNGELK